MGSYARPHSGPLPQGDGAEKASARTVQPPRRTQRQQTSLPLLGERAGVRASVNTEIQFSLATEADDPGIRRLLRENPMAGQISLSLERESDYFTEARHSRAEHQTIVARDRGRIVCIGTCSFRQRF